MKKVITIAICICLIFSSVVPSYAATNSLNLFYDGTNMQTSISAYQVMTSIRSSLSGIYSYISVDLMEFLKLYGSGSTPSTYRSFQDVAADILNIATELDVSTISGAFTIKELLEMIGDSAANIEIDTSSLVSNASSITSYLVNDQDDYLTGLNSKLNNLNNYNFQKYPAFNYYIYNRDIRTQHWQIDEQGNFGDFTEEYLQYNSSQHTGVLDYIVAFLSDINRNQVIEYNQLMTDVDATLSIWDSQGDSLTQSTWTPSSAMNGLYKYLAYTQRDVARLTHVLASDYEIEARDNVQDLQESFNDEFLDPSSDGAISTDNVEDISGLSGGIKENLSTNANASGIFDIFNSDHGGWFSQETANELDTSTPQNRGDRNADTTYPTPLLDERINEIYNALGVNNND